MGNELDHRRDRYDTTGNPEAEYVDEAGTVLVNRKGITDLKTLQIEEEASLAAAYETLLREIRMDTPLTCDLVRRIHSSIFGELYTWAGGWRTVWIHKPGTTWPAPDFLEQNMQEFERDILSKYSANQLDDDEHFTHAIAHIQGEFLVIHPFREGNARTIKFLTNLLAVQAGHPALAYDTSAEGKQSYINAAKAAFKKDYETLNTIIQQALERARQ